MKNFVSAMDIIRFPCRAEIISKNKCQMRFIDKLVAKLFFDQKLIINKVTCLMLESLSTSYYDYT